MLLLLFLLFFSHHHRPRQAVQIINQTIHISLSFQLYLQTPFFNCFLVNLLLFSHLYLYFVKLLLKRDFDLVAFKLRLVAFHFKVAGFVLLKLEFVLGLIIHDKEFGVLFLLFFVGDCQLILIVL